MKLIDRFVSRELIVNVLFAIAVLSLVLVVGNIFRKLLPLLVNHDVPMEYLITFIAYVLPFSLIFTIPWGLLTAILLVFGRLSADNELIALRENTDAHFDQATDLASHGVGFFRRRHGCPREQRRLYTPGLAGRTRNVIAETKGASAGGASAGARQQAGSCASRPALFFPSIRAVTSLQRSPGR